MKQRQETNNRTQIFSKRLSDRLLYFVLVSLVLTIMNSASPGKETKEIDRGELEEIRLMLHNLPNVCDTGTFMAERNGLFKQAGLPPVKIEWLLPNTHSDHGLREGKTDILFSWMADEIKARAQDDKLVCLALINQEPSSCFMVRSDLDPDITELKQLRGKKVAVWYHCELTPLVFLATMDINVEPIAQDASTNSLLDNQLIPCSFSTIWSFALLSEYTIYRDHVKIFPLSEYGCRFPEYGVFCRKSFLKAYPNECRKLVESLFKGWQAVLANPEESAKILADVRLSAHTSGDVHTIKRQLAAWIPLMKFDRDIDKNGFCDKKRYESLIQAMIQTQYINEKNAPKYEDFFVPVLDPNVYKKWAPVPSSAVKP